jgi:hypothetical protein
MKTEWANGREKMLERQVERKYVDTIFSNSGKV